MKNRYLSTDSCDPSPWDMTGQRWMFWAIQENWGGAWWPWSLKMIGAKETGTALRMVPGCKDTPWSTRAPQESSGLLTSAHRGRKHPVPGKEASKRLAEQYLVHKQTKRIMLFPTNRTRKPHNSQTLDRMLRERLLSSAAFCHSGGKNGGKASLHHGNQERGKGRGKSRCPAYPPWACPPWLISIT